MDTEEPGGVQVPVVGSLSASGQLPSRDHLDRVRFKRNGEAVLQLAQVLVVAEHVTGLQSAIDEDWQIEVRGLTERRVLTRVPTVAKCYRLLHAILATAVEDELIGKNPCVLRGASTDRPAERPVATVERVYELADEIGPSLRAMVLMATFTGLRFGELRALRRRRLDLLHKTVEVVEQYQELSSGELVLGPPKTDAGRRTVAIPHVLLPDLEAHLAEHSAPGPDGLVFCGSAGQPLHRKTFYRNWNRATRVAELDGFHFHDLRHTGNTLAAATGASTKELMSRMGHASPRAALIYQHATRDRDAAIAEALSDLIGTRLESGRLRSLQR
ncbi:MAG: tyrosine-type recombinase/integrase [Acidimicrobiales bacterium]